MEIINGGNPKLLSNYEVVELLKGVNEEIANNNAKNQNLSTVVYEVGKFLSNTPCEKQNREIIEQVMNDLKPFKLTKAEKLQILNQRPITEVEIALIIEESEERLSEEEVNKIIEIVEKLPGDPEKENADEVEENEPMEE